MGSLGRQSTIQASPLLSYLILPIIQLNCSVAEVDNPPLGTVCHPDDSTLGGARMAADLRSIPKEAGRTEFTPLQGLLLAISLLTHHAAYTKE